jgi:hypothetical protein
VNKRFVLSPVSLGLLLAVAGTPALAGKKPPENLFETLDVPTARANAPARAKNGKSRPVKVNAGLMRADSMTLNLFDDTVLIAERDRVVDGVQDAAAWVGRIRGEPDSEVVLALKNGVMAGTVKRDNGEVYEVAFTRDKFHVVRQVDPRKILPHKNPIPVRKRTPKSAEAPLSEADVPPMAAAETTTVVDLMVVYTPRARANAGGAAGIQAKIVRAVEAANQAYLNSKVLMKLNLVRMAEVSYTESGDMARTLTDLRGTTDGRMDVVHQWREQYGADQVALISADANYCGIGYQMTQLSSGFAPYAFTVTHDDSRAYCLASQTLAHELGHNQGNSHDRASSGGMRGIYSYSYGYRLCQPGGFRTVMAYPCGGAVGIPNFANPSVYYNGRPTGIDPSTNPAGSAADAWSMNVARTTVANWRPSKVAAAPVAPGALAATAKSGHGMALRWTDNSDDETGFTVERSRDGVDWKEIAVLKRDATAFSDDGLDSGGEYFYRVSAYNGKKASPPSEVASGRTTGSDD